MLWEGQKGASEKSLLSQTAEKTPHLLRKLSYFAPLSQGQNNTDANTTFHVIPLAKGLDAKNFSTRLFGGIRSAPLGPPIVWDGGKRL